MSNHKKVDFGILLNLAFQSFKSSLEEALADAGYEDIGRSFGYVFRLLAETSLNLRELADLLDVTPQGASKILADMQSKGYIERREDIHDKRVVRFVLTSRARKALDVAKEFHSSFEVSLARRVGAVQARQVRRVLDDIIANGGNAKIANARPT
jgi:DNA-binding MarR family transcriptional regulator